jgi:acyl-CoA synthetase (AMP-forming)/AMP-acid ligase II
MLSQALYTRLQFNGIKTEIQVRRLKGELMREQDGDAGIFGYFRENARRHPDKPAVIFAGNSLSYREVEGQVCRVSQLLEDMGITRGSHVLVLLNNSVEFVVVMLGLAGLGATLVPLSTTLGPKAIANAVAATDSSYVFSVEGNQGWNREFLYCASKQLSERW